MQSASRAQISLDSPGWMQSGTTLFNRNFVLIWQGQMVSQIGSQMFSLALLYWILETTGSATIMGLVLMSAGY